MLARRSTAFGIGFGVSRGLLVEEVADGAYDVQHADFGRGVGAGFQDVDRLVVSGSEEQPTEA